MRIPTLLTPLKYLRIRHGAAGSYNLAIPLAGSVLVTCALVAWPAHTAISGPAGYLHELQSLLTILGGFFVAALTLITSNQNASLQNSVGGVAPPTLAGEGAPLSRRRFLAYLFGYLAFSSFGLVGLSMAANLVAHPLADASAPELRWWLKVAFLFLFNLWLCHVAVATLLGLFYFTERLQVTDPVTRASRPGGVPQPAE